MAIKTLVLVILFGGMIYLAERMTARQFRLEQAEFDAIASPTDTVVGAAGPDGKFQRITHDLPAMRETWRPIRFPSGWESRGAAGFPQERAYLDQSMVERNTWCEAHCTGQWRIEVPKGAAPIFWFEDASDAREFMFAWFPFKCS